MFVKATPWNSLGETKLSPSRATNYCMSEKSLFTTCAMPDKFATFGFKVSEVLPKDSSKTFDYLFY